MDNTVTSRILVLVISILSLVIVFHQFVLLFEDEYTTEAAMVYSSAEKVAFNGVYVRNESVVTGEKNGVLSYPSQDGSKIAKDSVVAYVYRTAEDISINRSIEKLQTEVQRLKKEQNPGTTVAAQPEFISSLIDEKYRSITALAAKKDYSSLDAESGELQMLMGIYQIVIGEETDYNSRIETLEKSIKQLEAKQNKPIDTITVSNSGYFISYVDGYEKNLRADKLDSITPELIKEVVGNNGRKDSQIPKNAVGKIIDDYEWYLVGIVDPKSADFNLGKDVKIKLSSTPDLLTAKIEKLTETDNPDECMIVLSCEKLNSNLVQYRTERVEIILDDYSGIKVPREAIRFNKSNEKGVYIQLGQKIQFKKVDVIYESDEYLLSAITSDKEYISVYEDIIVEGEIPVEAMGQVTAEYESEAEETDVTTTRKPDVSEASGQTNEEVLVNV